MQLLYYFKEMEVILIIKMAGLFYWQVSENLKKYMIDQPTIYSGHDVKGRGSPWQR